MTIMRLIAITFFNRLTALIIIQKNNLSAYSDFLTYRCSCSYISNHMLMIIHTDANHTDGPYSQ